jgi:hypothetical protein
MNRRTLTFLLLLAPVIGQDQPPQPPPAPGEQAPGGVFRIPPQFPAEPEPAAAKQPEEPKKTVLENTGKPMVVPFSCSDDDIQRFGMTCTLEDPCPVYLELSGLQPVANRVFLTGNLHDGASTMYSMLLGSEDGGKTWQEPAERIVSGGLDQIHFIDFETGWISGQLLLALPRDPFFLLTTDGGKTWRKRDVFSESRVATVDQFHFDSRTAGTLIVDRNNSGEAGRWELYDTMTGGDSWMVRQVSSSPLRLKVSKAQNPDWRLRPDPATKSHTVERRAGGKWDRVASFSVRVGECRPTHVALPEPPSPPDTAPTPSTPRPGPRRTPSTPPTLKKR